MRKIVTLQLSFVLLLIAIQVSAQKRKKPVEDSLTAYREFVSLGKWYLNKPLQLEINYTVQSIPSVNKEDKTETNVLLYYGKSDFYMKTGELEQIVNDSLTVLVNTDAKIIKLFANTHTLSESLQHIIPGAVEDSSLQKLSQKYAMAIEDESRGLKKMIVQSRAKISGTSFNKETISIIYQPGSFQPVSYLRSQRSLAPIDSIKFAELGSDAFYSGRLVKTKTKSGELFFVMKEKTTACTFLEVSYEQQQPPVSQLARVVRTQDGEYVPAKGFEEYMLSKEY